MAGDRDRTGAEAKEQLFVPFSTAVELKLERVVPERYKHNAHHWLILHGRYVCVARKPNCPACIVSDLCAYPAKTIAVKVHYMTRHPKYGKFVQESLMLRAHDEASAARLGDRVELMECRPISKTKHWRLIRVVEAAPQD